MIGEIVFLREEIAPAAAIVAVLWGCAVAIRARAEPGRGRGAAVLLAVAGCALVAAVLGPGCEREPTGNTKPNGNTLVVVDTSRSMATTDQKGGVTRLEAAVRGWIDQDTDAVAFDTGGRPWKTHAAPEGDESNLAAAVLDAVRTPGVRDVVILSDGAATDRERLQDAADTAAAAGVRVHGVCVGTAARQIRVDVSASSRVVRQGRRVRVRARIGARGLAGEHVRVALTGVHGWQGEHVGDREPALRRVVTVGPEENTVVDFDVYPVLRSGAGAGVSFFRVDARVVGTENERAASHDACAVRVVRTPVRVLVLEARPNRDTRAFVDAVAGGAGFDCVAVWGVGEARDRITRVAPEQSGPGRGEVQPPRSAKEAIEAVVDAETDVLVLGGGVERWIGIETAEKIQAFVQRGGGVLFLSDDPVGPGENAERVREILERVAPAEGGGGTPGRSAVSGTTLDAAIVREFGDDASGEATVVWAETQDGGPAVLARNVGQGRAARSGIRGSWAWAIGRDAARRTMHRALWRGVVQGLAGTRAERGWSARAVQDATDVGGTVQIRLQWAGTETPERTPGVVVSGASGPDVDVRVEQASGAWWGVWRPETPGWHAVAIKDAQGQTADRTAMDAVYVRPGNQQRYERVGQPAEPGVLAALAAATGGKLFAIQGAEAFKAFGRENQRKENNRGNKQQKKRDRNVEPLAPAWVWAAGFGACACGAWLWRRMEGLV